MISDIVWMAYQTDGTFLTLLSVD